MILYCDKILFLNGIYTWMLDFCKTFSSTVITKQWNTRLRDELSQYAITEEWQENKQYKTDVLLATYDFKERPNNIVADRIYTILHCDYGGIDYKISPSFSDKEHYIAVSKYAAENFTRKYGLPCDYVEGLLKKKPEPRKVLRLISCTRLMRPKGSDRMTQLCKLLRANDVRFVWDNYSEGGIINMMYRNRDIAVRPSCSNNELLDYIASADYLVQLTESEGYCRAVHEALLVGTPVIVSDIPIFRDVVKNGQNGYRLPLDMQGIDVQEIVQNIPRGFTYDDRYEETFKKWQKIINE